jgi:lipase maturation factor 1
MTTRRLEISVEGSHDGREWREYVFAYKPGDPERRPVFVAPHQPRLDWQMWFAALSDCRQNQWFIRFLVRLLEGSPAVLSLLERNPFPEGPPRYLRTTLHDYRFTDPKTRSKTGAWWRREPVGPYCPTIQRD